MAVQDRQVSLIGADRALDYDTLIERTESGAMAFKTIAILSAGEMGGNTGGALAKEGYRIVTSLAGRSEATRERALSLGFHDSGSVEDAIREADIVFSILPPGLAVEQAEKVAAAMKATGCTPPFIDCNAVAPQTAHEIGTIIGEAGAEFIDGGIVGNPPGKNPEKPTRFYVSGPGAPLMAEFHGKGIDVRQCGPDLGRASAIKMCYAGVTKGTSALHTALLMAAEKLGVADEIHEEYEYSIGAMYARMENMTPGLPAVAERYAPEMDEIAKTLGAIDLPTGFHEGAAELYRLLTLSPYASEIRETVDRNRTMRQTVEGSVAALGPRDAAE